MSQKEKEMVIKLKKEKKGATHVFVPVKEAVSRLYETQHNQAIIFMYDFLLQLIIFPNCYIHLLFIFIAFSFFLFL